MAIRLDDVFDELSALLGSGSVADPYPVFAERRRETPVMTGDIMAEFGLPAMAQAIDGSRPMFTMFRYDDISRALRDGGTFSSSVVNDVFEPVMGRILLGMDGEEHRSYRGLLTPVFARRLLEIWRTEVIRPVARRYVEELAATGKSADLLEFGLRFPVRMIYEIMGLQGGTSYDEFARSGLTLLLAVNGVNPAKPDETARLVKQAIGEAENLYESIVAVVARRRAEGADRDDFIGHLLRTEFEGARLDDSQIAVFIRSLIPAAAETTTRTWLNVMVCLLDRPDVVERITSEPELLPSAIDEANRLEPAATVLGRITTKRVEVRGVQIPAGAGVTLAVASGNRDADTYENPDVYDLDRKGPPPLSFGTGPHVCPGQNTAKIEMHEATQALFDILPNLRIDPSAPPSEIRGVMMRSPTGLPVVWD